MKHSFCRTDGGVWRELFAVARPLRPGLQPRKGELKFACTLEETAEKGGQTGLPDVGVPVFALRARGQQTSLTPFSATSRSVRHCNS